jgi:hypothetical protein
MSIVIKHAQRASVAQSVATGYGLLDRGVELESRLGQGFSLLHFVQASSGSDPASYRMDTAGEGGFIPGC